MLYLPGTDRKTQQHDTTRQTTHTILTLTLPNYLSASSPIYSIIISYYDYYCYPHRHTNTPRYIILINYYVLTELSNYRLCPLSLSTDYLSPSLFYLLFHPPFPTHPHTVNPPTYLPINLPLIAGQILNGETSDRIHRKTAWKYWTLIQLTWNTERLADYFQLPYTHSRIHTLHTYTFAYIIYSYTLQLSDTSKTERW